MVTMCREGDSAETVATTNGRAFPGMETRIAPSSRAADGELLVRGDYVMLGYLDDPEATREAIDEDGWLHTGDVGSLDEPGNLRITDRLKDMYISGGFNVYPAEVEQALARLDGVADVAVVGVPDERMGEVGKAYVVARPGSALTEDDVSPSRRSGWPTSRCPRQVELVEALPRNLSGKVLKTELPGTADGPRPLRVRARLPGRGPEWLAANVPAEPLPSMDTAAGWALHQEWEAQARRGTAGRWCPGRGPTTAARRRWSSG